VIDLHEFENFPDDGMLHELDEGELIITPPTQRFPWRTGQKINALLSRFLEQNPIGEVCPSDAGFLLSKDPDTMRAPNVAFLTAERAQRAGHGYVEGAPDLAVEILSPSDSVPQLMRKVRQYLKPIFYTAKLQVTVRRELAGLARA
jgi:Uma2 family endonuclease